MELESSPKIVPPCRSVGYTPGQSILFLMANGRAEGGSMLSWRLLRALRSRDADGRVFITLHCFPTRVLKNVRNTLAALH